MSDVLERLPRAEAAGYDSLRTEQNRVVSCSEGTRMEVLQKIQEWASRDDESGEQIFWLSGLAGIGKSTIAMSVAKWASSNNILGASFFFARDVAELSDAASVFTTLAWQLAQHDSQYKRALYEKLRCDSDITSKTLATQFQGLVESPLSGLDRKRPIVVVLDALDECSSETDVKELLRIFLGMRTSKGVRLRILITSRPEPHIRFMFSTSMGTSLSKFVLHDIDDNLAREDIRTFFVAEFAKFPSRDLPRLPADWPPPEEFDKLLDGCGKFFAYAATAVRFI
ncbi:hypothetical protein SCHPADRAFT_860990, partial [Schizopora paradoxa]